MPVIIEHIPWIGEDSDAVESVWDAEVTERVKDVKEGRVTLISGAEFQCGTDALFAELGIKRLA
ncbi:MAG: addiction module protein [Prosthecobacter sp.]|uniref:addiction module protein n=1 Tax=Prosthecobacter sp. TaxID=1965333 RepID=UPI003BAEF12A